MTITLPDIDRHQGWTNRATWSTHLWLANTEEHYREILKLKKLRAAKNTPFHSRIKGYCQRVWGKKNPDGVLMRDVNWVEIADAFVEDSL